MSLFSMARAERWDITKFQNKSLQLSQFLRGDFSSIRAELDKVFPNTSNLQERFVPLVQRYAYELTGFYGRPVVRRFFSTQATNADPFVKLREVYRASKVDRALHQAHRELMVQQTVILAVLPDGVGKVKVMSFEPWQVEWEPGDPLRADDIQHAEEVELAVPVGYSEGFVTYGELHMSASEIYIEKGGQKLPVYGNSTANPFGGKIPLIVLRAEQPQPGRWASPVNEPLLSMQIALCLSEADTELLVHTQAWGQKVLENAQIAQQVEEMQVGPDRVLALVNTDPTAPAPRLTIVQGQPPLAQITSWNESRLRLLCSMFDLQPDAFLKVATAVTASARAADANDREQAKDKYKPIFADAENELCQLIAMVLNLTEPVQIPADTVVEVRYQTYEVPADPLHESQALQMEIAQGIVSPVDVVADRDGVTRQSAYDKIKRNLQESRDLGVLPSEPVAVVDVAASAGTTDATAVAGEIQGTALNGAQVQQLTAIVQQVTAGQLPTDSAVSLILLAFPLLAESQVRSMIDKAGRFTPRAVPQ